MLAMQARGAVTFDYGNNIRAQAVLAGVTDAFDIHGFVPEYVRPLFCEGKGPFRWAALSGDPADIAATDELALQMFAEDAALCRWIHLARERIAFQGLPARIFWLGYGPLLDQQIAQTHARGLLLGQRLPQLLARDEALGEEKLAEAFTDPGWCYSRLHVREAPPRVVKVPIPFARNCAVRRGPRPSWHIAKATGHSRRWRSWKKCRESPVVW
jgi:hypothetical protein